MIGEYDPGRAIYLQLMDGVRERVVSGVYAPGQRLPGVRDLAYEAKVNPNTMQRALSELEDEGLLVTKSTAGRFVTGYVAVIEEARQKMLVELTERYLAQLERLNVGSGEAVGLIERSERKA